MLYEAVLHTNIQSAFHPGQGGVSSRCALTAASLDCLLKTALTRAGLGNMKRKKPKLVALGIKPVRTAEKNIRHLWRADVEAASSSSGGGAEQVHIHLAGNGFLYRCVALPQGSMQACLQSADLGREQGGCLLQVNVLQAVGQRKLALVIRQNYAASQWRHCAAPFVGG